MSVRDCPLSEGRHRPVSRASRSAPSTAISRVGRQRRGDRRMGGCRAAARVPTRPGLLIPQRRGGGRVKRLPDLTPGKRGPHTWIKLQGASVATAAGHPLEGYTFARKRPHASDTDSKDKNEARQDLRRRHAGLCGHHRFHHRVREFSGAPEFGLTLRRARQRMGSTVRGVQTLRRPRPA